MAAQFQLVTRERHGDKAWRRVSGYLHARDTIAVPVAAAEVGHAARALPLAFIAQGGAQDGGGGAQAGAMTLMALMGLMPGQNLFVAPNGRWAGAYVPAFLRGYPFRLGKTDDAGNFALVIDEASGLVVEAGEVDAVPFFAENGIPAKPTQDVLDFLVKTKQSADNLQRAAGRIAAMDLLEPWPLKVKDGETERPLGGIFRVSEERLNALPGDRLVELRTGGGLGICYAQLLSSGNVSVLGQLAQAHAQAAQRGRPIPPGSFVDEVGTDDELKIDWDDFLKDR